MSILKRKQTVGAKIEVTEGTAIAIAGADIFPCYDVQFSGDTPSIENENLSSSMSKSQDIPGRTFGTLTFKCYQYGSSAAGSAPFWGKLLQACAYSETISAGVSVTYGRISSGIKSLTMKRFMDGKSWQIVGARGNVSRDVEAGGLPVLSFSFQGIWDPINDVDATKDEALLVGTALPTFDPKPFKNANLTIGGSFLAVTNSLNWDAGNSLANVPDANTTAYKRVDITDRSPSGSFDTESVLKAAHDFEDEVGQKTPIEIKSFIGSEASGNGTGTLNTMTDAGKNWPASKWASGFKVIDSAGAIFTPTASTATTLTVSGTPASGNYSVYQDGRLITETIPKAQFQSQDEGDSDGRATDSYPFMMKKNAAVGDDEQTIVVQ